MWAVVKLAFGWFTSSSTSLLTGIYNKYKDSKIAEEALQATWAAQQLQAMETVRLATAGFIEMRVITAVIGGVFTLHLVLVGLDTMFHWTFDGRPVSAFPAPMDQWEGAIILSFFGLTAGMTGLKAIAAAWMRK